MASKSELPPRLLREKLAFRYSSALESGDFETLASILQIAVQDGILAEMLREIDEVYAREMDQGFRSEPLNSSRSDRPARLTYWVALAAAVALIFVAVINLHPNDNNSGGFSSKLLTPIPSTSTGTLTPTLTITPAPTVQPSTTAPAAPSPTPTGIVIIPGFDLQIPTIHVPEIESPQIPGFDIPIPTIHIPEVVISPMPTVDLPAILDEAGDAQP